MSVDLTDLEDLLQPPPNQSITSITNKEDGISVDLNDGTTLQLTAKTSQASEITFYNVILPTLRFFEESESVEELAFIPRSYGDRNLNFLLIEDLKEQRYKSFESFNLGTTRQILKDLASFHAIPLSLKLKDPKVFDIKVKRHLNRKEEINTQLIAQLLKTIGEDQDYAPYIDKIKDQFEEIPDKAARAPFSTMVHNEFFWKNIMVKTDSDGFVDAKVTDFQQCSYGSLAEDLILFLYSSVDLEVLEEHSDGLIEFYHSNLVRVLEECRCDPTPFSLDALFKEMKIVAKESQFVQVLLNLFSTKKGDEAKKRMLFAVKDFVRRNWV